MRLFWTTLLVVSWATATSACGDKFLVVGRTSRALQFDDGRQTARILIVQSSPMTEDVGRLQGRLRGFHPDVDTVRLDRLTRVLDGKEYDVVLVDFAHAPEVAGILRAATSTAVLLPLVHKSAEQISETARKTYAVVLEMPTKTSKALKAVQKSLEKQGSLALRN